MNQSSSQQKKTKHFFLLGALVLGLFASSLPVTRPANAMQFGGPVLYVVPPIYGGPTGLICPMHMVVSNYGTAGTPIGIHTLAPFMLYERFTLYLPGKFLLGQYTPAPFVTCPFPYPVVPLMYTGTS